MKNIADLTPAQARQESRSYKATYIISVPPIIVFSIMGLLCSFWSSHPQWMAFCAGLVAVYLHNGLNQLAVESKAYTNQLDRIARSARDE